MLNALEDVVLKTVPKDLYGIRDLTTINFKNDLNF